MTKRELRKIYKKRISFDSSLLVWLLLISSVLLVAMFIIEIAMLDMKIKDIVLWTLLVLLATCVLLMIYLLFREEFHKIKTSKKETVFEFIVADDNLSAAKEYLTNKRYWCAQKSKNSNLLVYTNSYSSSIGNFVLHFLVVNNKIRISMFIKSTEKRFFRQGFSKYGLYGMVMYPAKIKFRKHLAVVLELLGAPEEFKI